jgi:quercetin dioxygenase-like cupin family protein
MATDHIASASGGEQLIDSPARQGSFVTAREDLTITHACYAAGEQVAGRHIHHQHTDAFYILEGEVIFEIGPEAETITVPAGGFVAAPPGLAHAFRVADGGPARWLTIHAPDGGFAAFMRGLRDGIQVEWDIASAPSNGGLPADQAIICRPPRAKQHSHGRVSSRSIGRLDEPGRLSGIRAGRRSGGRLPR